MNQRKLRRALEFGIPATGVLAIMAGAFVADDAISQAALTVIGVVLLLVSSFDLDESLLPNQRRFNALRAETNQFLRTVRRMNRAAYAATQSKADLDRFQTASDELVQRARVIADTAAAAHGISGDSLAPTR